MDLHARTLPQQAIGLRRAEQVTNLWDKKSHSVLVNLGQAVYMGVLIPEDFPFESLKDDAERHVVRVLRDGLR
ncbi:MAG: hypothetical protein NTX58_01635, partial [Actinobacteria bacterium]|nr:hypothetical protein [Actinomycetota bacterium]